VFFIKAYGDLLIVFSHRISTKDEAIEVITIKSVSLSTPVSIISSIFA